MKTQILAAVPLFASLAYGHGVILAAKGPNSKVASVGMQVVLSLARNCTGISPCQQDTSLIRDAEIANNVVNECGRTELAGNIDIGENTENQLAAGQVADVNAGDTVDVTIHQVNADGAGPYTCDLEQTGNTGVFEFKNLSIANNVPGAKGFSQAKEQDFTMQVQLPDAMNCTGSSQGNVCTLRCRNNALAGPFGGCVALQQKDGGGRASDDPANVPTNLTLDAVAKQVAVDKLDLNSAIAANQKAGSDSADQGVKAVEALLQTAGLDTAVSGPTSIAAPIAGATAATSAAAVQATSANANANGNGNANNNANGNGNGNGNANKNNANRNGGGNNANANANANANGNGNGRGNRANNNNANAANANNNNN